MKDTDDYFYRHNSHSDDGKFAYYVCKAHKKNGCNSILLIIDLENK